MSIRERIIEALDSGTVLHGTSLMTREDKDRAHTAQMASKILAAICPEGVPYEDFGAWDRIPQQPKQDGLDQRFDEVFNPDTRITALADRIGDLETWRGSVASRLDAFDAKQNRNINMDKDINNAIERLERQVFGVLQPKGSVAIRRLDGDESPHASAFVKCAACHGWGKQVYGPPNSFCAACGGSGQVRV